MTIPIQSSTVWGRLADAFRLTGRHKLLLDEVISPVVLVEDLTTESADVQNDATAHFAVPAAGAGDKGFAVLANLNNPGTDLLVDRITFSSASVDNIIISLNNIAPLLPIAGATLNKAWNDFTQQGVPSGTLFASEAAMAATGVLYQVENTSNTMQIFDVKLVIGNNAVLSVGDSRSDVLFHVTIQYRVVPANRRV